MTKDQLYDMQFRQNKHDIQYHRDIIALGTEDRIKHLVLHFSKYLDSLINNEENKILADIVICLLSLANTINIRLIPHKTIDLITFNKYKDSYITSLSNLAKATEALDHFESYPSREVVEKEIKRFMTNTLGYMQHKEIDINDIVTKRLKEIEEKSIFHGKN